MVFEKKKCHCVGLGAPMPKEPKMAGNSNAFWTSLIIALQGAGHGPDVFQRIVPAVCKDQLLDLAKVKVLLVV